MKIIYVISLIFILAATTWADIAAEHAEVMEQFFKKHESPTQLTESEQIYQAHSRGDVVVSPLGPSDGGDFGKFTPGTKTAGLQEAFDYAKAHVRDLYIVGGSWTHGKNMPAVYILDETLRIPWMQDFRMDSGINVIVYRKKTGDAIVMDSQMSCYYRFGILKADSNGATLRLKPETAGPDGFKVLTTTELHVNAIVGGGGAWQSGKGFDYGGVKQDHPWIGAGLMLDGSTGSIDSNKISIIEVVGCEIGVYLTEKCTNNWIDVTFIHLSSTHLQVGKDCGPNAALCPWVYNNRIDAYMDSHGIEGSAGARIFGRRNILTLSANQLSAHQDIILGASAEDNLIFAGQLPNGITNNAVRPTNKIITISPVGFNVDTPDLPKSGEPVMNRSCYVIEVTILHAGQVDKWTLTDANGTEQAYLGNLYVGQSIRLQPGEKITFDYQEKPIWRWRAP